MRENIENRFNHKRTVEQAGACGFSEMLNTYFEYAEQRKYSSETILLRRQVFRRFISFLAVGKIDGFKDVSLEILETYRISMFDDGLSPNTIQVHMGSIRMLFDFLEERNLLFENPTRNMVLHKQIRAVKDVLTESEAKKLLAAPDTSNKVGLRDRALLEVLYSTGVRREELIAMTVFDIDTDRQTIRVIGKGRKERILPLGKHAARYVELYLRHSRPKLRNEDHPKSDMLWWSIFHIPLGIQMPRQIVKLHARKAGIEKRISTHTMRRSCATHLLKNGAHPLMVAELLGHSCLTVLSNYLKVTITDLTAAHARSKPGR